MHYNDIIRICIAARIDDGDEGCDEDDWQQDSHDWWWVELEPDEAQDKGRCLGIRCNIWARALRRREITHHLRGGGSHNIGWGALRWQELIGTDEVRFVKNTVLRYLPKKNCKLPPRVSR